jgi:Ca2+-binding RTX toxin-like protein
MGCLARCLLLLPLVAGVVVVGAPAGAGHNGTFGAGHNGTCQGLPATIIGTAGRDHLTGTPNRDVAAMGRSADHFSGFHGDDLMCGDRGNDYMNPGRGDDHVYADSGRDLVPFVPRSGRDTLFGGTDGDALRAGGGDDVIRAGAGPDLLVAGSGEDDLRGWTGDDVLKAAGDDGSRDYLEGGPGHDTCHVQADDVTVGCEDVIVHGNPTVGLIG